MRIRFAKYEGAGNDFILIDARDRIFTSDRKTIARLCDRHFGIGADGLMTLTPSRDCDCTMRYYNADGSEGEMCGNGARCFTLFAEHLGIGGEAKRFEAADGLHEARLRTTGANTGEVELGMISVSQIVQGDGWWFLNTGVPHYVEFVDRAADVDVEGRGRTIRRDLGRFPQGTNVNFVEVLAPGQLRLRTYERGVEAETLACGTGATAAAIVANYALQPGITNYTVAVAGGMLGVCFDHTLQTMTYTNIRLSGNARSVFEGEFDSENF